MLKFTDHKMINSKEYNAILEYVALQLLVDDECNGSINEAWEVLNDNVLTESALASKLNKVLSKAGLSLHKSNEKGLLSDLMQAGKGMFKFIMAAVKGDTSTLKKMANKEISKEELIDFIIKLDTATGHILSGPIHTIHAITGWHIGANVHHASNASHAVKTAVVTKIRDAIDFIKVKLTTATHEKAQRMLRAVTKLEDKVDNTLLDS